MLLSLGSALCVERLIAAVAAPWRGANSRSHLSVRIAGMAASALMFVAVIVLATGALFSD